MLAFVKQTASIFLCRQLCKIATTEASITDINSQDVYRIVFNGYPEVLDVKQVSKVLGVSTKTVYKLIGNGALSSMKVGREFRVPKVVIMNYVKVFGFSDPSRIT